MDEIITKLKGKVKKIGVMGGTFDPIHFGHLVTAEVVRIQYNLDRIIFIPSGNPPHKQDMRITSGEHRYVMVQLAVASNPKFEVSRMEIDREGLAYTVDTIKEIRSLLGSDIEIYFITGADAMLEILTWRNVNELLSLCTFTAVTRPGYRKEDLDNKIAELRKLFSSNILTLEVPAFDISSTVIRQKAASNYSIKYLVPEDVENYIIKNNLYTGESELNDR